MKINIVFTLIAIAISLLLGYFVYDVAACHDNADVLGIGTSICFLLTTIPAMAIDVYDSRIKANLRVFSWIGVIVFVISNFTFALTQSNMTYYIIVNGLLLLIFIAVAYSLVNAKQS